MKPLIVGIAGGTASGKTTTSRALVERLDCLLITHDQYYKTVPDSFHADPGGYNFDHPAALDTARLVRDLDELRQGRPTELPAYDFSRHTRRSASLRVEPRPLIFVEGILVLAEAELRDRMQHSVFVHAPADVRLIRRIRRDVVDRGRAVDDILEQWERTVRPMHDRFVEPSRAFADLVVDGTAPTESMVASVLRLLSPPRSP